MKYFIIIFIIFTNINLSHSAQKDKAYFAGGCFWCMEESFEKLNGVEEVISGYSGGVTENPTYKEVTYGNTGHFEVVEVVYNKKIISYEKLLENFWFNIFQNSNEKKLIEKDIKELENRFNKKVVTYIRGFEKFYRAEEYHQDFYKIKLERYLRYKKACGREEILKRIWSQ